MRAAGIWAASTSEPISHSGAAGTVAAASAPKPAGITIVAAFVASMRRPSAWPWRSPGVTWCSMARIIGCTEPSARPSSADPTIIPAAPGSQ